MVDTTTNKSQLRLKLDIVTPEKKVLSKDVDYVSLPGKMGSLGVLPEHTPLLSTLTSGVLSYEDDNNNLNIALTGHGFAEITGDKVIVLIDDALLPEQIDGDRALSAKKRAEERLKTYTQEIDTNRARAALMRAITRLKVINKI